MRFAVAVFAVVMAAGFPQGFMHVGTEPSALAFDVASVRQNKSGDEKVSSNVPLGPGNVFAGTGGVLTARNFPLVTYVSFAYRMTDAKLESFRSEAPGWVLTDRFDIQAKTEKTDVTKDEVRLMMRELLAERFALRINSEMREVPVYGLVRAGELGRGLRVHTDAGGCAGIGPGLAVDGPESVSGGFPTVCGGILVLTPSTAGGIKIGGSKVPMRLVADSLTSWGQLKKPVVDKTGLTGDVDFVLEYAPMLRPEAGIAADDAGPTFKEALRRQLGLMLEAQKAPVEFLVLDHIGPLTEN